MPVFTQQCRHAFSLTLALLITLSVADEEAAAEDGIPRVDVTIADCGQL